MSKLEQTVKSLKRKLEKKRQYKEQRNALLEESKVL